MFREEVSLLNLNLRRIIWIVNLAVLVLLGYLIAGIALRRPSDGRGSPPAAIQRPRAERDISPITQEDCSVILRRNVFSSGEVADGAAGPGEGQPAPLVRTKLQLRLLGTVAGDAAFARAAIEDLPSRIQDVYKIGDIVQGARIEEIKRNRVILIHENRREVLELYLFSEPASEETARAEPAAGMVDAGAAVRVISPDEFEVDKKAFLARVGGIEAILKTARLTPYVIDGKTKGLRVTGLENVSMARFVGLKNADVIQTVNGQMLSSQQKAFQVFRKARAQSTLKIQLLRDKDKKTLSFRIK